jgi:hypothetical protein
VRQRRDSTIRSIRTIAIGIPKSLELEQRVARVELLIQHLQNALDLQAKLTIALQAQLDHIDARLSGR